MKGEKTQEMKMLYYIAQTGNENRFESLFESEDILASVWNANDIPSLMAFVTRDRSIASQNFVIIDVGDLSRWSSAHVLSAVQHFRRFSAATLIFIAEPGEDTRELYGALAGVHHVDKLLTAERSEDITEKLKVYLRDEAAPILGRTSAINTLLAEQAERRVKPLHIPKGQILRVAVAGTMPRVGTTTQAFALYHCFRAYGLKPAILDREGKITAALLPFEEDAEEDEAQGITTVRDIAFCTEEAEDGQYNCYIEDCGELSEDVVQKFGKAKISVLVAGTKAWELKAFARAMQMLFGRRADNLIIVLTSANEEEIRRIEKYIGNAETVNAPHRTDLWKTGDLSAYAPFVAAAKEAIAQEEITEEEIGD